MMMLYRKPRSPNSLKVLLLLEEAQLPYRIASAAEIDADLAKISPLHTTPALVDAQTGAVLFESAAILFYLAEQAGRFLGETPAQRGEVMKWLIFEAANVAPACENIYQLMAALPEEDEHIVERYRQRLCDLGTVLDNTLSARPYIAGECSIADFALYPWMSMLEDFADVTLDRFAHVQRWLSALAARPAMARALQANA